MGSESLCDFGGCFFISVLAMLMLFILGIASHYNKFNRHWNYKLTELIGTEITLQKFTHLNKSWNNHHNLKELTDADNNHLLTETTNRC